MTPGVQDEEIGEEEERGGGGGGAKRGWRNARPEERMSEHGRELVRAGSFPLANSRARDRWRERGKDKESRTNERNRKRGEREKERDRERGEGGERERERERKRESSKQEKRRSAVSEMGRKFSSSAFICSLNEMRMHYTWIAGDINFLP